MVLLTFVLGSNHFCDLFAVFPPFAQIYTTDCHCKLLLLWHHMLLRLFCISHVIYETHECA